MGRIIKKSETVQLRHNIICQYINIQCYNQCNYNSLNRGMSEPPHLLQALLNSLPTNLKKIVVFLKPARIQFCKQTADSNIHTTIIYFFQGKHIGRLSHQDPGEFPEEVKTLFEKAVQYYEQNMALMIEIGDRAAQGRACGNLGNVHYLLGNFSRAIHFHQERLKIGTYN